MTTIDKLDPDVPLFVRSGINLASAGLGAKAISATDEFFAPLERMLEDDPAIFYPDRFDDNGKWMDGWETRRRRGSGHDHAVIRLATAGRLLGFDVDTSHFTGNYAPAVKIEACHSSSEVPAPDKRWVEILPNRPLGPSAHHYFRCESYESWTHLRIHIYPDGGVARLRAYGVPELDPSDEGTSEIDLVAALNGGRVLAFSDAHYGDFRRLLAPGRGINMADGWETRRRREPGYDWLIVALGARGTIDRAVVDTHLFKGNYPDSCTIQAADLSSFGDGLTDALVTSSMFWDELLPRKYLKGHEVHEFDDLADLGPVTHVRFNIHPDGGVSRLRLFGKPEWRG
jgi:allantoicase